MLLTNDERRKFAEYLIQTANGCDGISGQFQKLDPSSSIMKILAEREKALADAARLIADMLLKIEDATIEAPKT